MILYVTDDDGEKQTGAKNASKQTLSKIMLLNNINCPRLMPVSCFILSVYWQPVYMIIGFYCFTLEEKFTLYLS